MESGDIYALPEACMSYLVSLTSPQDACVASLISSTFKSAADSDAVWGKFLPPNWRGILARLVPQPDLDQLGSLKKLYFKLCDEPHSVDGRRNMIIRLDRRFGKISFTIGARELNIVWADTPRYWKWTSCEESRFEEVAELLSVCWLYITGTIDTSLLSPKTAYGVYLVIRFTDNPYGLDHLPEEASVNFVGGEGSASGGRIVHLNPVVHEAPGHFPVERGHGWMELEMGEFYSGDGEDGTVEVCLNAKEGDHWKGGLVVEGVEVRPIGN